MIVCKRSLQSSLSISSSNQQTSRHPAFFDEHSNAILVLATMGLSATSRSRKTFTTITLQGRRSSIGSLSGTCEAANDPCPSPEAKTVQRTSTRSQLEAASPPACRLVFRPQGRRNPPAGCGKSSPTCEDMTPDQVFPESAMNNALGEAGPAQYDEVKSSRRELDAYVLQHKKRPRLPSHH